MAGQFVIEIDPPVKGDDMSCSVKIRLREKQKQAKKSRPETDNGKSNLNITVGGSQRLMNCLLSIKIEDDLRRRQSYFEELKAKTRKMIQLPLFP